jgi:hypothetical protein
LAIENEQPIDVAKCDAIERPTLDKLSLRWFEDVPEVAEEVEAAIAAGLLAAEFFVVPCEGWTSALRACC